MNGEQEIQVPGPFPSCWSHSSDLYFLITESMNGEQEIQVPGPYFQVAGHTPVIFIFLLQKV